jgi:hypothetical protein
MFAKDTTKAIQQHCRWVTKRYIPHPQSLDKTIEARIRDSIYQQENAKKKILLGTHLLTR